MLIEHLDIEYGLDAELLRSLLDYDPLTGLFTWRSNRSNVKAGTIAGCFDASGYWQITVLNRSRKAHRLAHLYMTGNWPTLHIDHINQVRHDNRWGIFAFPMMLKTMRTGPFGATV